MRGPTKLELHQNGPASNSSSSSQKESEPPSPASEPIDKSLLTKAVQALVKHHNDTVTKAHQESNTTPLLGSDVAIHVQFSLARVPEKISHRPIRLNLPHPLCRFPSLEKNDDPSIKHEKEEDHLDDVEVCLIVKDEAKPAIKELIDAFPHHKAMARIKKVLTLTSLRKKYGKYADRRELLARFDVFMADDRILPMLGRALGKNFFEKKKQPIPIRITQTKQLPFVVDACLRGTFLLIRPGTCISIKAGYTNMSTIHLMENIQAVISQAVLRIPRKWANIMSISIKTHQSVALPIYNKTREELQLIADMANIDSVEDDSHNFISDTKKKRPRDAHDDDDDDVSKSKQLETTEKQQKDSTHKSPLIQALKKQKKEVDMNVNKEGDLSLKKDKYVSLKSTDASHVGVKRKIPPNGDEKSHAAKVASGDRNLPKMKANDVMKRTAVSDKSSTLTVQKIKESAQRNDREAVKVNKKPDVIDPTINAISDEIKSDAHDSVMKQSKGAGAGKSVRDDQISGTEKKKDDSGKSAINTTKHLDSERNSDSDKKKSGSQETPAQKTKNLAKADEKKSGVDDKKPGKRELEAKKPIQNDNTSGKESKNVIVANSAVKESKTAMKLIGDKKNDDTFISAGKFTGAKKGYVFRSGSKGLGYYKDLLPIVDANAIKKIARGK